MPSDLVADDFEVRLVPLVEPHRIAIFSREDADQPLTDGERNHQHALGVWQRRPQQRRMKVGSRVVIGLQTTALVFMSIAHYV